MRSRNNYKIKESMKNKNNIFLFILSFIIVLFTSLSINNSMLQARISNLDYLDYPQKYSAYNLLHEDDYESFMKEYFTDLKYKEYYCNANTSLISTNIVSDNLEIEIMGCVANFETFPIPSAYSNTIVATSLMEGDSFSEIDLIKNNNTIIMYYSHLKKINYKQGDLININGKNFILKGVLQDNSDVKRNYNKDVIQIFIPYTTFLNIFKFPIIKTVVKTDNYTFPSLMKDNNFISYEKVKSIINNNYNYNKQASLITIVSTFAISFIATIIVQYLLIRGRYNEIGIRRAVGASRDSIVFMFTTNSLKVLSVGILLGLIIFFISYSTICLVLSNIYYSSMFILNISKTIGSVLLYLSICFISILIPSAIGSNINISNILVEEK